MPSAITTMFHAGGEHSRTDQVREHHRDLAAFSGVLALRFRAGGGCGRCCRHAGQLGDGGEHDPPMPVSRNVASAVANDPRRSRSAALSWLRTPTTPSLAAAAIFAARICSRPTAWRPTSKGPIFCGMKRGPTWRAVLLAETSFLLA